MTLLADVNRPGSQEDMVSNLEPGHSLVEDASLWGQDWPCLPALAFICLPLCLWQRGGPVHSQLGLLWYLLNPLFHEWAKLHVRVFCRKVLSLSLSLIFSSLVIPQFELLSHVSSIRFSSAHSGPFLTLSMLFMPSSPASSHW